MVFENILNFHCKHASVIGGNYSNACKMLESALNSKNLYHNIDILICKHEKNSEIIGGNFLKLISDLKVNLKSK